MPKKKTGQVDNMGGATDTTDPTYNVRMLTSAENAALKELLLAEVRHVDEMQKLHVSYQEKLTLAESKRIDAIRAVDVAAVQTANDRAIAQAQMLATQVQQSAETLRSLVATTAQATASQYQAAHNLLADRITVLEKAQYTGFGRSAVEDPLLSAQSKKMEELMVSSSESKGRSGLSSTIMMLLAGLGGGIVVYIVEALLKTVIK